ncbi:MAG: hypothetical protein CSA95_02185 [Bacteroidetes bacterium]|nr:MAG: hypothetical protein CSA95_02185 [Bacteroidota bacterium]
MKNLTSRYPYHFQQFTLTEVVRQQLTSGILAHATTIRQRLTEAQYHLPLFGETHYPDFIRIDGSELQDALEEAYSYHNEEHAVVVTRSNKRANLFNQEIRKRILFREGIINAGDLLMVTRNNYFWMPEEAETRFIANGDLIEILRIKKIEVRWGFQFADVEIRFPHFRKEQHIETKILLDTLTCEGPALPRKEMERLWYAIMEEQMELSSKAERIKKTRNSAWFNALQVKFAYAITCHKTQGGQWDTVFIDQGFMREPPDKEWFRWIYTAITRAMKRVYLVNFREDFWY